MPTTDYTYSPDYAVPPGWVLEDRLAARNISYAEFARRCGRSPKLISEIIAGKAPIEPRTALQFENVLGVDAGIWLGIEASYRLRLEREAEARRNDEETAWAKAFPVNELVKRGIIEKPKSNSDKVKAVLSFFGVASVDAWRSRQMGMSVAYRHSPSFKSNDEALSTWLRLGELEADQINCPSYNRTRFRNSLLQIRELTATQSTEGLLKAKSICQEVGVVLAVVKPIPKTALSGATRWITPRKALIQLSARHMSDDHLWFSFFHEAAHIMLHSKSEVFIETKGKLTEADAEADRWASEFLIPPGDWEQFRMIFPFTEEGIKSFAEEQGIAPGIIVGRLQHEGLVPWQSRLNSMKVRLEWSDDAT
jgi:addiction module HigA family antidote